MEYLYQAGSFHLKTHQNRRVVRMDLRWKSGGVGMAMLSNSPDQLLRRLDGRDLVRDDHRRLNILPVAEISEDLFLQLFL